MRDDPGLSPQLTFDPAQDVAAPFIAAGARPKIAILREQGVNGQVEMAAAFDRAGFAPYDVHMSDLQRGRRSLWTTSRASPPAAAFPTATCSAPGRAGPSRSCSTTALRDEFAAFFARADSFALGRLQRLPDDGASGVDHSRCRGLAAFPAQPQRAVRGALRDGRSASQSPSLFLAGMAGSRMPIVVCARRRPGRVRQRCQAGRARWSRCATSTTRGAVTEILPVQSRTARPAVSPASPRADGRFTIMMPHPERVFRTVQMSWAPPAWRVQDASPWLRMFANARRHVG